MRVPRLYGLLAAAAMGLPLRSRLRRLAVGHVISRGYAAINRRDFDRWILAYHPSIEYRPAADQLPPGVEAVCHGRAEVKKVWEQMIDSFEDFRAELREVVDLGDRLLISAEYSGHGSGSGIPISVDLCQFLELREGRVVRQVDFADRAKAFEVAGLDRSAA